MQPGLLPNFLCWQAADHERQGQPVSGVPDRNAFQDCAMEPACVNKVRRWDRIPGGQNIYLDQNGNPMSTDDFDKETKQLLADYKLIQYDITAGKTTSKTQIL